MKPDFTDWFDGTAVPLGQVPTHWSRILAARGGDEDGRRALKALAEGYYGPVYRTLRCMGLAREPAMEMAQRFMVVFCEGKYVQHADPARGSFRAFLKTSLRNFLFDEREKERRRTGVPIEAVDPAADRDSQEEIFDREIAQRMFEEARDATRDRLEGEGAGAAWQALRQFDLEPEGERSHPAIAARLGMELPAFRRALYRARAVFREEVCRVLREGLPPGAALESEIDWFLKTLAR